MQRLAVIASTAFLLAGICGTSFSQTKCIWIEHSENGKAVSSIGISYNVAKILADSDGNFNMDGAKVSFDTLMYAYRTGNEVRIADSAGNGETRIYGGTFHKRMEKGTDKHRYLFVESTDSSGTVKVTKLRAASVQAVGIVLAMIGSKNFDEDIDKIESVLEPGGILYIRDLSKKSSVWVYVN